MSILSSLLLSISANLDTFAVAISYGIKKVKLSSFNIGMITIITTIGTFISMYLGLSVTEFIPLNIAEAIGSIMLIGIGIFMIIDYYKKSKKTKLLDKDINIELKDKNEIKNILDNPINADKDNSGSLDFKESLFLSFALTINNLGIGVVASIAGISIYLNTIFTFIITLISLILGVNIGNSYISKVFGKYTGLVSGVLMIILGSYEYFI